MEENRFFKQAFETLKKNDCKLGDTIDAFNKKINTNGISPTVTTRPEGFKTAILVCDEPKVLDDLYNDKFVPTLRSERTGLKVLETDFRIRKLTPKECWRLMGFEDEDFNKAKNSGVSNSQLYKQAGNSIVVNVLEEIFKQML